MKTILKLEEAAQLLAALFALTLLPLQGSWWAWLLLFFVPDISMAGYAFGPKAGGIAYNLAHHKATAAVVLIAGLLLHHPALLAAGLLLWAHASFDRLLGYGLKHLDSFTHTHLGPIGKAARQSPAPPHLPMSQ